MLTYPAVNIEDAINIDGWMSIRELHYLARTARDAKIILEVGSYKGRSTRALADNTDGVIYCVDPWNGDYYNDDGTLSNIKTNVFEEFHNNLRDHIDSGRVHPVMCKFCDLDRALVPAPDFVFIDGDHRYQNLIDDIIKARSMMSNGGILSGHDYNMPGWPSVQKAVDTILGEIEVIDTIWIKKF